jgi:DNA-binding transcriptional LysR family regulator
MDAKQPLDWDDFRLLLAVARAGSFQTAARGLGAATSTVSRRLTRFEAALGTPLLERRNDGVRLTDAGRSLAAQAEDVELRLHSRVRELPAAARGLEGTIRVTAGDGFADVLNEAIAAFAIRHPAVSFEVVIEGRPLDLARREADLAIRTGHGRESSLVYRTVGRLAYGLYASRDYTGRRGEPRSTRELRGHSFIGFAEPLHRLPAMRWLREHGAERFVVRATTFSAVLAATRAGLGIAPLPELTTAGLRRILPRARFDPQAVYLVTHPDARRLPSVRAFADVLADRLGAVA